MRKQILLLLLIVFFTAPSELWAQSVTVTGTVIDYATNSALPGVNIIIDGTTSGTITDVDGNYRVTLADGNATLVFSFIGYTTERVEVGGRSTINVSIIPDIETLGEVVVVGYGTQRKADLTSSIATVDAEDLEDLPVTGIEQALQGRAAGVTVTSNSGIPGSPVTVRIRGIGTVNNNEPLYIVDGVPVDGMNYLNPADIGSIQILKDASAAAIYGSRAANGVVLITTKQGKEGKPVVSLDSYVGVSQPWKDYESAGRDEYLYSFEVVHGEDSEAYANAKEEYDQGYNTNWWNATVNTAVVQNYNLGVSGGSENMHYNFSANYFDQEGAIDPSGYERLSLRINTDYTIHDKIKIGENLSISNQVTQNTYSNILAVIQKYDPLVPVINPDADLTDPYSKWGNTSINFGSSPSAILARQIGDNKTLRLVGNVYGSVDLFEGLVFNTNFGVDIRRNDTRSFSPTYYFDAGDNNATASASSGSRSTNGWMWSNTLNYSKTFGSHSLSILLGTQAEQQEAYWINGSKVGQPGNENRFHYIDAGTGEGVVHGNADPAASIESYFGRVNYNFKDRYLLSGSVRRDGSSKFASENRWGTFPAFSAGWVISQEDFWNDLSLPWLTSLKLRGGWGQVGNQNVPVGGYTSYIDGGLTRRYLLGGDNIVQGYYISNIGNSELQWETSEQSNIGLELGFFNGALRVEAEYYSRKTNDMLIEYPIAATFANISRPWVNAGNVSNKGFEFTASYNGQIGELEYSVGGNISHYKNEVMNLGLGQPYVESMPGARVTGTSRTAVGHPIGEFYGYKTAGIFQSDRELSEYVNSNDELLQPNARQGDIRFVDVNGDGAINDEDKTSIGSPHPKLTYGGNIELRYKEFDLSIFIQGSYGNKLFNINKYHIHHPVGFDNFEAGAAYNAWTPENGSNSNPIMSVNDPNNNYRASDWYVEDGSYMRIKNLQLGYTLPEIALTTIGVSQFRVYIAAQNLFTFTGYSGLDPEIGAYFVGDIAQRQRMMGTDYFTFPQSRTFQVGVNLKF